MDIEQHAFSELHRLLPLDTDGLREVVTYCQTLSKRQAAAHLEGLAGDSPDLQEFLENYGDWLCRAPNGPGDHKIAAEANSAAMYAQPPPGPPPSKLAAEASASAMYAQPPQGLPPSNTQPPAAPSSASELAEQSALPGYAPPAHAPPPKNVINALRKQHTNAVIEAATARARDEVSMQNMLQRVQLQYRIYNSDIEPEHDVDWICGCSIHQYKRMKWGRLGLQNQWSRAVMYPGEKEYSDVTGMYGNTMMFTNNPYAMRVVSPFPKMTMYNQSVLAPSPKWHAMSVRQTIALNAKLNTEAQAKVDAKEPKTSIWSSAADLDTSMSKLNLENGGSSGPNDEKNGFADEKPPNQLNKRMSTSGSSSNGKLQRPSPAAPAKQSFFKKVFGVKTQDEKISKHLGIGAGGTGNLSEDLRDAILAEEDGRWPDEAWRQIVTVYQEKVGMTKKIAELRRRQPIQYLHLLRAGYFEPIPVAWANLPSNPLKFSIESAAGWRGITPSWRGYEDTAEERLYWVLNHREGSVGTRLKPDFISAMDMARERMASAVQPPPEYFSPDDTCHVQHTSKGYSVQVMPRAFQAYDRPEVANDDTMILLDVSGSMDFDPMRPNYDQYLITNYVNTRQPKNKDVAKAIIRRFTDAMSNHDHAFSGYDLITFANSASHIGTVTHSNLDSLWASHVKIGGGTRVMTGWQKIKELHFEKHRESATHHPVYGWQAGPETPMLRLLLLLDGEATDMDEFELDLLGLGWAHVTIFLIGAEGCPHHHRHANELQRISDVNHHVSFVDAQGNTPERFVTHELLKRHLGYSMSLQEFKEIEVPPPYTEMA